jgi:hypothetical protein
MDSSPALAIFSLIGAAVIFLYLARRLRPIIQRREGRASESDILGNGRTAQALYALAKPNPNFSSVVEIMRENLQQVKCDDSLAGRDFLQRAAYPGFRSSVDSSDFAKLYRDYAIALRQAQVE